MWTSGKPPPTHRIQPEAFPRNGKQYRCLTGCTSLPTCMRRPCLQGGYRVCATVWRVRSPLPLDWCLCLHLFFHPPRRPPPCRRRPPRPRPLTAHRCPPPHPRPPITHCPPYRPQNSHRPNITILVLLLFLVLVIVVLLVLLLLFVFFTVLVFQSILILLLK